MLHLNADEEKLKAAPEFEMSKWAEQSDVNHLLAVYRQYGEEPAFRFIRTGDEATDGQRVPEASPDANSAQRQDRLAPKGRFMIPASRLGQLQKASKIIGTSVQNLQDEKLGKVENLLVDLSSGRIVAVVVSTGGFLGIGDELSAVPPSAFRFTTDQDFLQLDTTKEVLAKAPHFQAQQWPDFAEPTYSSGVYRAYQVEPYFTTGTSPDHTARDNRDRDDQALTPLDQGNSKADVAATAQIRKEIYANKELSVNAHNVKVITLNGRVTLRGPVGSVDEKRVISEIADRAVGAANVDNQLVVKPATASSN